MSNDFANQNDMRKWPTAISSGPVTYCIDGVERHPSPKIVKWIKLQRRMNHFLMYLKNETFSSLIHGQNVCTVVIPQNEFPKCSHNAIRETALFECREPNTMDQLIPKLALIAVFLHLLLQRRLKTENWRVSSLFFDNS